jgi:hypothetical protein
MPRACRPSCAQSAADHDGPCLVFDIGRFDVEVAPRAGLPDFPMPMSSIPPCYAGGPGSFLRPTCSVVAISCVLRFGEKIAISWLGGRRWRGGVDRPFLRFVHRYTPQVVSWNGSDSTSRCCTIAA